MNSALLDSYDVVPIEAVLATRRGTCQRYQTPSVGSSVPPRLGSLRNLWRGWVCRSKARMAASVDPDGRGARVLVSRASSFHSTWSARTMIRMAGAVRRPMSDAVTFRWREAGVPVGTLCRSTTLNPLRSAMISHRKNLGSILSEFWRRVSIERSATDRLVALREYAEVQVKTTRDYGRVRRGTMGFEKAVGHCFACGLRQAIVRHHVVQVQHGGRNRKRNLVHLCRECHAYVHRWKSKSV